MPNCKHCGGAITNREPGRRGRNKVYCSLPCRKRAEKARERGKLPRWDRSARTCERCGGSFDPQAWNQMFCSRTCRTYAGDLREGRASSLRYYRELFVEERGSRCEKCGDGNDLQVHHIVRLADGGENTTANVLLLCRSCHAAAHNGKTPTPQAERSPEPRRNKWEPSPWQKATQSVYK